MLFRIRLLSWSVACAAVLLLVGMVPGGVTARSLDALPCDALPAAEMRLHIPSSLVLAPGDSVTFEPTALPPSMPPSSFSPVYVCVNNASDQPLAVQFDFGALILVAPVGYVPQVVASLLPAELPVPFRGCVGLADEPSGIACQAGGRILGGRGILSLTVSVDVAEPPPETVQRPVAPVNSHAAVASS